MMYRFKHDEKGSYTLEALIALTSFVVVIMLVYSQVKAVIGEQIIQHAVNDIAKQVSSYVYVLDRAGLVIQHAADENQGINKLGSTIDDTIKTAQGNIGQMSDLLGTIFKGDDSGKAMNIGDTFKQFADGIQKGYSDAKSGITDAGQQIKNMDWKKEGKDAAVAAADNALKMAANLGLKELYGALLNCYLPMEQEKFCKFFCIKQMDNGKYFDFSLSKAFPNSDNNSIFVAVTYSQYPQYRFANVGERKIVKGAYTAAWVKSNAHEIK